MTEYSKTEAERLIAETRLGGPFHPPSWKLADQLEAALAEVERLNDVLADTAADAHHDAEGLRAKVDKLTAERDAMRTVMEAAGRLAAAYDDTSGSHASVDAITECCSAVVRAYRAAKEKP